MKSVSYSLCHESKNNKLSWPRRRFALDVRKEAGGGGEEVGVEIPQQFFNYKDNGALDSV